MYRRQFLMYVQKSHLLKNQTKSTLQLHLSGSSIHVAYFYLTRVIMLLWNCEIVLQPDDFQKIGLENHCTVRYVDSIYCPMGDEGDTTILAEAAS